MSEHTSREDHPPKPSELSRASHEPIYPPHRPEYNESWPTTVQRLDTLEDYIYGTPEHPDGVLLRLDRLERGLASTRKILGVIATILGTALVTILVKRLGG